MNKNTIFLLFCFSLSSQAQVNLQWSTEVPLTHNHCEILSSGENITAVGSQQFRRGDMWIRHHHLMNFDRDGGFLRDIRLDTTLISGDCFFMALGRDDLFWAFCREGDTALLTVMNLDGEIVMQQEIEWSYKERSLFSDNHFYFTSRNDSLVFLNRMDISGAITTLDILGKNVNYSYSIFLDEASQRVFAINKGALVIYEADQKLISHTVQFPENQFGNACLLLNGDELFYLRWADLTYYLQRYEADGTVFQHDFEREALLYADGSLFVVPEANGNYWLGGIEDTTSPAYREYVYRFSTDNELIWERESVKSLQKMFPLDDNLLAAGTKELTLHASMDGSSLWGTAYTTDEYIDDVRQSDDGDAFFVMVRGDSSLVLEKYGYTSTTNDTDKQLVQIYPNPTRAEIQFSPKLERGAVVNAYDVTGQKVLESRSSSVHLDLSHLDAGIYYLEVTKKQETTTYTIIKI